MWIAAFAVILAMAGQGNGTLCVPAGPSEACFDSDKQTRENGVIHATGNVVVVYQDMRVEADWVKYDEASRDLTAGDVIHFTHALERLDGDKLLLNLGTKVGIFTNVKGKIDPGFYIVASEAIRLPDGRYDLRDVTTTACEPECESWFFRTRRMNVDPQKERWTATSTIFRFRDVPLFYLPWFFVPTEGRERSSGFLTPTTGSSTTKGRSFRETFYYAMNRSADATITGEYFSKRGSTVGVDFRARPDQDTSIFISTLFAHDKLGQGGRRANIYAASSIAGFRSVLEMNVVSSLAFRQVYENGFNQISSPIERVQGLMTRNSPGANINLMFDRSTVFFPGEPNASLRRLPAIHVSTPTKLISGPIPVYFNFETGLTGYSREDSVVQTPGTSGRLDLHPTFDVPLFSSLAYNLSARFGVRETAYSYALNADSAPGAMNRVLGEFGASWAGPRLERSFGALRHVIEPTIEYHLVTGADRFRDTVVVDDVDLYADTSDVTYGVVNHLLGRNREVIWRVFQKVFFERDFGGALVPGRRNAFAPLMDLTGFSFSDRARRFSPVVSSLSMAGFRHVSADFVAQLDTELHEFRNAGVVTNLTFGLVAAGVSYYYSRGTIFELASHQAGGGVRYGGNNKPGISISSSFAYDVQRALFQGAAAQVGYNGGCYGVSVLFETFDIGVRKESRIRFAFALKNVGAYGTLTPAERLY